MNFIGDNNIVMDNLHKLPRPRFVARHPWALYDAEGNFHSRYASAECAARTLIEGSIKGAKWWTVVYEPTGDALKYEECWAMVRRRNREVELSDEQKATTPEQSGHSGHTN